MLKAYETYGTSLRKVIYTSLGSKKVKAAESLFTEIVAESFPNLRKDLYIPIHETNRSPQNLNPGQFLQDKL